MLLDCDNSDKPVLVTDDNGYSAAHHAASNDDPYVLALLISRYTYLFTAKTVRGMSLLHIAVMNNSQRVIEYLLNLCDKNIYESIINSQNQWFETPVHLAAAMGHTQVVSNLLSHGASLSVRDRWGRTPAKV